MKEQKSNTAAFGGASFWKEISDWFSLFDLVLKKSASEKLLACISDYTICLLVGVKVLGWCYPSRWAGPVRWIYHLSQGFPLFSESSVVCCCLKFLLYPWFGMCPKTSYVPDRWGAEHLLGIVSVCCSKWVSKGCEKATCYEAASQEYMGVERVSGVAAYTQS